MLIATYLSLVVHLVRDIYFYLFRIYSLAILIYIVVCDDAGMLVMSNDEVYQFFTRLLFSLQDYV